MIWILLATLACGAGEPASPAPAGSPATVPASTVAAATADRIEVAALQPRVAAGDIFVLDVRTPGEFAQGHVPGAVNVPVQELEARLSELDARKQEEIAVICASGNRSKTATALLRGRGFDRAMDVSGGTSAWVRAGYPVE